MPNWVEQFSKKELKLVFQAFGDGLADYYISYAGNNATEAEARNIIEHYFEVCDGNSQRLLAGIASEIAHYCNYYGIEPRPYVDEFKLIYFTGMTISLYMKKMGHVDVGKVVQYATVILLDERLKKYTSGKGRPELKERLFRLIRDGLLEERMGPDGMYLVYKCVFNVAKELVEESS